MPRMDIELASTVNVTPSDRARARAGVTRRPHVRGAVRAAARVARSTRRTARRARAMRSGDQWRSLTRRRDRARSPGRTSTTSQDLHEHGQPETQPPPRRRGSCCTATTSTRARRCGSRSAVGSAADAPDIEWIEVATAAAVIAQRRGRRHRPADPRRRGATRSVASGSPASSRTRSSSARRSWCSPVARRTPGWRPGRSADAVVAAPLDPVELHAGRRGARRARAAVAR